MIPRIDSGYSSPVYTYAPDFSDVQSSAISSSDSSIARVKKGVAEYRDSFETAAEPYKEKEDQSAKRLRLENAKERYLDWFIHDEEVQRRYDRVKIVKESEKAEQIKAFRPHQPMIDPVSNVAVSLNAHLTANILSMIRV